MALQYQRSTATLDRLCGRRSIDGRFNAEVQQILRSQENDRVV
jgi:hypothetical protein